MALYERALAINEAAYGAHHTEVATTLTLMSSVLKRQGKLEEARALRKRAQAINEAA